MTGDAIVFDDHGYYIGVFGDGSSWRWPAAEDGWAQRKVCPAPDPDADDLFEYGAEQARLALKLSGAVCDD